MDERYGKADSQRIQDTQWIEEASLAGDVLLCKDLAIAHNALEAQVVYMTSARVFALSNASLAGPAMAQWFIDNEARIVAAAVAGSAALIRCGAQIELIWRGGTAGRDRDDACSCLMSGCGRRTAS